MLLLNSLLACTGLTLCSAAALAASSSKVLLPKPSGYYQVGRSTAEVVDHSRTQPFTPNGELEPRKLMISVFYPVVPQHPSITGEYMLPETAAFEDTQLSQEGLRAPKGTFEKVALNLAGNKAFQNLTRQPACHHPLVVFMGGEGTTRLFYQQIVSTIASNGYTVVNIDAPYDVDIVQYPDGSLAIINETLWNNPNQTQLAPVGYLAIETRVQDVSFVLDQLSNKTLAHSLIPNLPSSGLNTAHTAMFGHSLGGASAFSILEADPRILGALDMDGGLFGPGLQHGTSKPFMLMGSGIHPRDPAGDATQQTWAAVWPAVTGWKRDVRIADTLHYDFSDYPILFESLGLRPSAKVATENLLVGSLGGKRTLTIVSSYVTAFLDFVIYGKCSALLDGPVSAFPEVIFEY
jgi:hypothetical protein